MPEEELSAGSVKDIKRAIVIGCLGDAKFDGIIEYLNKQGIKKTILEIQRIVSFLILNPDRKFEIAVIGSEFGVRVTEKFWE